MSNKTGFKQIDIREKYDFGPIGEKKQLGRRSTVVYVGDLFIVNL